MRAIFAATLLAFSVAPALTVSAGAQALAGYGIVLLHGKGGQPGGNIASLATALEADGAAVVMPKMAWAGAQGRPEKYDVAYEQALTPIKAAVEQLKARAGK